MESPQTMRQFDLLPPEKCKDPINVIGAGAIGSHVTLYLARMGFNNITVWDFDEVSIENMNSQGYRFKDIGFKKVDCLKEIVKEATNVDIKTHDIAWDKTALPFSGIVLACADSMKVRREIWDSCFRNAFVKAFIDSRMGAEEALLYCMKPNTPHDDRAYRASLYSDDDASPMPCTAKATCYTATMLSGLVCKAVKDIAMDLPYPREAEWNIRDHYQQIFKGGEVEEQSQTA